MKQIQNAIGFIGRVIDAIAAAAKPKPNRQIAGMAAA